MEVSDPNGAKGANTLILVEMDRMETICDTKSHVHSAQSQTLPTDLPKTQYTIPTVWFQLFIPI